MRVVVCDGLEVAGGKYALGWPGDVEELGIIDDGLYCHSVI
jgi:hypothetical protein